MRDFPPLSIFIIACDEASRIARAINAVRPLTDDLVVVDSGSRDGTAEIAESMGARVLFHAWPGYGMQKRFAEGHCRHDWVLNIDADEVVSPELAREISLLFSNGAPVADAYHIRIVEVFPTEQTPQHWAYSTTPVRLYRRSCGRYSCSPVHDRVELARDARISQLENVIHHFSTCSLSQQVTKFNAYTDAQADDLDARAVCLSPMRLLVEFPLSFAKAYIGRRHALRGLYGFMTAMNFAFYRYLRLAKHVERRILRRNQARTG